MAADETYPSVALKHDLTGMSWPIDGFVFFEAMRVPVSPGLDFARSIVDRIAAVAALSGGGILVVDRLRGIAVFHRVFSLPLTGLLAVEQDASDHQHGDDRP